MIMFTVSELNRYIAFQLKGDARLQGILLRGEISNFTCYRKSGHCYFTLKDADSAVKAVMFASYASKLRFDPRDGMRVIAVGSVGVFERDGAYQVYVNDLQPDGVGANYVAFLQLKEKLSGLGYFDEAAKQPLPALPKKIGVITSPEGAALQDILHIIGRRCPIAEVVVYPAMVQGEQAPGTLAAAVQQASQSDCDVLILGRGGGSAEDLQAFNTEAVARAIHDCPIPFISAVGHETDYTIADLTADMRAPTPSAAAELAVPTMEQLRNGLDALNHRLADGMEHRLSQAERSLQALRQRLAACSVEGRLNLWQERLEQMQNRLNQSAANGIARREAQLMQQLARLDSLSPVKVLTRGYALVYHENKLITSVQQAVPGDELHIRLGDGEIQAVVQVHTGESYGI